jgi:hypothetical protein
MERGMRGNFHVPCGAGEKLEIKSNAYLLPPRVKDRDGCGDPFSCGNNGRVKWKSICIEVLSFGKYQLKTRGSSMVTDISFKFIPYYDTEDYSLFDYWGKLDILIDGVSFFSNYKYRETKGPMGNSTITREGFAAYLDAFLWELPFVPQKLLEKETVIVLGEGIDKSLIFFLKDNIVTFAICNYQPWEKETIYYDGLRVSKSKKIPQNNKNMIGFDGFKQGLKNGLQDFIQELIEKYPSITNEESLINIRNTIDSIN